MIGKKLAFLFMLFIAGCGGALSTTPNIVPMPGEGPENLLYDTNGAGEERLRVEPLIESRDELYAYRDFKIAQAKQILEATREQSEGKAYYPVVVTMARPISLPELNSLIKSYNPSTSAEATRLIAQHVKALPKTEIVKDVDTLVIDKIRFVSTTGSGQLSYETLTDQVGLARLEAKIAAKEMQLNGVTDFRLIKGVTSIEGGIHRDQLMRLEGEPKVFLADIGPKELYDGAVTGALWRDLSKEVNQYAGE